MGRLVFVLVLERAREEEKTGLAQYHTLPEVIIRIVLLRLSLLFSTAPALKTGEGRQRVERKKSK